MDIWQQVRDEFPVCQRYTYLNPAGGSPVSLSAAQAAKRYYDEMLAEGDNYYDDWLQRTEEIRSSFARYIGAESDEIAFTTNTSHGMNLVAHMLKQKGKVLTMEHEFPSSTYPWINQQIPIKMVKAVNGQYPLDQIEAAIDSDVKILMTSYVQYSTGFRQDLEALGKLCQQHGLLFVVNATQAIPVFPVDVKKARIDFLVFTGLKWATAGYGIGGLYIRKKWLQSLSMPFAGWQSTHEPEKMDNQHLDVKQEASVLEAGCPHFAPIFALGGALQLFNRIGQKAVTERILMLTQYLHKRLNTLGVMVTSPKKPEYQSGITIVRNNHAQQLVSELKKEKIIVSARGEGIRISVNIFNNEEDIDVLIESLSRHSELL